MRSFFRHLLRLASLPAAVVMVLLLALWTWGRALYAPAPAWKALGISVFLGWLLTMFLATTLASILWTAGAGRPPDNRPRDAREVFLGFAMLLDACGLLLLCVGLLTGILAFLDIVRVYLLLAAWAGMWAAATWAIRHVAGRARAAILATSLAMLLFAAPVTLLPLARGASTWGPAARTLVLKTVRFSTPMLGVVDAIKPSRTVDWAQLPEMYKLTAFGQDIPLDNPHWWTTALTYTALTLAAIATTRLQTLWQSRLR